MKTKNLSYSDVAHNWVHKIRTEGSSKNCRMSFEGDFLYSYNTLIGRKIGDVFVLTNNFYSNTTNTHISEAYYAIPNNAKIIRIPHVPKKINDTEYAINNYKNTLSAINDCIEKSFRSIKYAKQEFEEILVYLYNLIAYRQIVHPQKIKKDSFVYKESEKYCKVINKSFRISSERVDEWKSFLDKHEIGYCDDRIKELCYYEKVYEKVDLGKLSAKLYKSEENRRNLVYTKPRKNIPVEEKIAKWKKGKSVNTYSFPHTMLRLKGVFVETSKSIKIPIGKNMLVLGNALLAGKENIRFEDSLYRDWHLNKVKTLEDSTRIFFFGCHDIPESEIVSCMDAVRDYLRSEVGMKDEELTGFGEVNEQPMLE